MPQSITRENKMQKHSLLIFSYCFFMLPSRKYAHKACPKSCHTNAKNHRIIVWPELKRTTMSIVFQPPAMCRVTNQQTRLPRATSSLALNASRDGASLKWDRGLELDLRGLFQPWLFSDAMKKFNSSDPTFLSHRSPHPHFLL